MTKIESIKRRFRARRSDACDGEIWLTLNEARQITSDPEIIEDLEDNPDAVLVIVLRPDERIADFAVSRPDRIERTPFDFLADREYDNLIEALYRLAEQR